MASRGWCLVALAALLLLVAAGLPAKPPAHDLAATAATMTSDLLANRTAAGRGDPLLYTLWLNVSGGGQVQRAFVNLTFEPYPNGTSGTPAVYAVAESHPAGCFLLSNLNATRTFLAWQCGALKSGTSNAWTVSSRVNASAAVGHAEGANATAVSQIGTAYVTNYADEAVYISGIDLGFRIESDPAATVRPGDLVQFWVNVSNPVPSNASATNVTVRVAIDPGLQLAPGDQALVKTVPVLTPGSNITLDVLAVVATNVTPGSVVAIRATLDYTDFNGMPVGPLLAYSPTLYVGASSLVSFPNLAIGAGIGLATVVATTMTLLYLGQRRIAIDEVFLMHRNGLLIRHATRVEGLKRDDDLVASMFVAIQDFVRDSFETQAVLDQVSFGDRQAGVVRGDFVILAAVISKGDVDHLYPELLATVRTIEATFGPTLAAWDGRMSRLQGIEGIMDRLLRGGFRAAWRARIT